MIEHVEVVIEEVDKMNEVDAIREVLYPSMLSNTVVVKKKMASGEFTLTSQISTELVSKTTFHRPRLISWWIQPQTMTSLPSNSYARIRPRKDNLHHSSRDFLLQVLWG